MKKAIIFTMLLMFVAVNVNAKTFTLGGIFNKVVSEVKQAKNKNKEKAEEQVPEVVIPKPEEVIVAEPVLETKKAHVYKKNTQLHKAFRGMEWGSSQKKFVFNTDMYKVTSNDNDKIQYQRKKEVLSLGKTPLVSVMYSIDRNRDEFESVLVLFDPEGTEEISKLISKMMGGSGKENNISSVEEWHSGKITIMLSYYQGFLIVYWEEELETGGGF